MMDLKNKKQRIGLPISFLKKWSQVLLRIFYVNTTPVLKLYYGFGTSNHMEISGHALAYSPFIQKKFSRRAWRNSLSLLRLFIVKPIPDASILLKWGTMKIEATTDTSGFFHAKWVPNEAVSEGWQDVVVSMASPNGKLVADGKILVPPPTKYAVVSDIDDTFLISHSSQLRRRLYVLLTSNARTRQPFEGVVHHYQLLARADGDDQLRPFFYVSSSEWNLYDYIREFARCYELPDGIYLLSAMKNLSSFWKTGQGKHELKYKRIERLFLTYPDKQFILLGDDSQEDPNIYRRLAEAFPGRIVCIYLRHIRASRLEPTRIQVAAIKNMGVEICYFTHSMTAIAHSQKVGLIKL